jgi:hypothetical protein
MAIVCLVGLGVLSARAGDSVIGYRAWFAEFTVCDKNGQEADLGRALMNTVQYSWLSEEWPVRISAQAGYGTGWDAGTSRMEGMIYGMYRLDLVSWADLWLGAGAHDVYYFQSDYDTSVNCLSPIAQGALAIPVAGGLSVVSNVGCEPAVFQYTDGNQSAVTYGYSWEAGLAYRQEELSIIASFRQQKTYGSDIVKALIFDGPTVTITYGW